MRRAGIAFVICLLSTAVSAMQSGGTQYGSDYVLGSMVPVVNGLFTATVPAPTIITDLSGASAVWIELEINSEKYPRQLITPEIYSLTCAEADDAASLGGTAAASYALKTDIAPDTSISLGTVGVTNGGTGLGSGPSCQRPISAVEWRRRLGVFGGNSRRRRQRRALERDPRWKTNGLGSAFSESLCCRRLTV
jgi:hypothetical protein